MRVLMLGPLVVERDGQPVDLGGPRQRSVLAVLLLARGRVVSLDRLIDVVYGGDPPPSAVGSMQAYISGLRRVLEPGRAARAPAQILVSAAPGYALHVADDEVDAWRFLALAERGRQAVRDRRWQHARDVLEEALALWRGEVLADLDIAISASDLTRFEEAQIGAVTDAAEADLGLGQPEDAVARLGRPARENPLRERIWESLALALYRCGRQADALAACTELRRTLRDELGLDAGPALTQLEAAILRQDPGLDGPSAVLAAPTPPHVSDPVRSDQPEREPFVGRDRAMGDLVGALGSALGGTTTTVLVLGPAGSGKSRLVEEFALSERTRMATVVWGRGTEGTHRVSLRGWRQIVDSLDGQAPPHPSQGAVETAGDGVPDPNAVILAIAERVLAVARAASRAGPLVIMLEDLHWLDDASLRVARIVLGELTGAPVLIVATVRDDEASASDALLATLEEMARIGARRVELPPLTPVDVETYVACMTGDDDRTVAARVFARTAGHPFFVVEVVRLLLSADGAVVLTAESRDVPGGVRAVVRARVSRLPGPTRTLLAAAAVLGDHAIMGLLEAASGLPPERMLDAVEPALVTRIVVFTSADAPLLFTHSLVRQAVADEVTSLRRARILAAATEAAEAAGWQWDPPRRTALADLALSASEAGGFSSARAVALARSAAEPLAAAGSFAEAAALLGRAVAQARDGVWLHEHELLVELGRHQLRAGDLRGWSDSVEASLELAVDHRDWEAGGRSLSSMLDGNTPWSWLGYGRVRHRPVELLTQLIALIPAEGSPATRVKCLATAVLAAELYFTRDSARCQELSQSALELARTIGDPVLFATVVALSEMAVWASDGAPPRIALRREALARGLTPTQKAAALYRNAMDLYQIAHVKEADQALGHCVRLVAAHHTPGWEVALGYLRASRLVARGDLDAGEQLALQTSVTQRRTTMGGGDGIVSGLLLSVRLEQGRLAEALPPLERALAGSRLPVLSDAVAFVLAHTGRLDDAEAALARGEPTPALPDDGLLTGRLAFRSYARYDLLRAGRAAAPMEAKALRDRLRPSAGQLVMHGGGISVWGAVDLFLAMTLLLTGDRDAAIEALHRAVEVNEAAGHPAWGARARRLLAQAVASHDQGDARTALLPGQLTQAADAAIRAADMPTTAGSI